MLYAQPVDQFTGVFERDRYRDMATRDDPGFLVELQTQLLLQIEKELVVVFEHAAGSRLLGEAEQQRGLFRNNIRIALQHFGNGQGRHPDQFGPAAPGLLQRHLAPHDPLAAAVHEAGLLEVVDGAADGGTACRATQSDAGHHACSGNGQRQAHQSSSIAAACCSRIR